MNIRSCSSFFSLLIVWTSVFITGCSTLVSTSNKDSGTKIYSSPLVINEVVTSNSTTLTDQFGNTPDWIELYNSSDTTIDLAGYTFTDNPGKPAKWTCGSLTMAAKSYAVICASDSDVKTCAPEDTLDVSLTGLTISSWADNQNTTPGNSFILPVLFKYDIKGYIDNKRTISAKMYLDDNSGALTWQIAQITALFSKVNDYSAYDKIRITAMVEKGKILRICVCQTGVENNYSYGVIFTGTGMEDDSYEIPISDEAQMNPAAMTGFLFSPGRVNDSVTIKITGITMVKSASYMHTGFNLSSAGSDTLMICNPQGNVIAKRALEVLPSDYSQGIKCDDTGSWVVFDKPTPGRSNDTVSYSGIAATISTSSNGGFYSSAVTVTLSKTHTDNIYYTTDGSLPTTSSI